MATLCRLYNVVIPYRNSSDVVWKRGKELSILGRKIVNQWSSSLAKRKYLLM